MALEETQVRVLEHLLIEQLLQIRREYLMSPQANRLKWAELMQSRLLIAARTAANAEELITSLRKKLQLGAPTRDSGASFDALVSECRDQKVSAELARLVENRHAYLMAMVRKSADEAKEARESNGTATNPT